MKINVAVWMPLVMLTTGVEPFMVFLCVGSWFLLAGLPFTRGRKGDGVRTRASSEWTYGIIVFLDSYSFREGGTSQTYWHLIIYDTKKKCEGEKQDGNGKG
jgi:hypothetical protein